MTIKFITLGCRVNQVESQALMQAAEAAGFCFWEEGKADAVIINSCTVTGEADRKTRSTLRRARREHPEAVIALTGCMPQADPDCAERLSEADIVTGTRNKGELISLIKSALSQRGRTVRIHPHREVCGFEELFAPRFDKSFQKAFLKIEDGCDRGCAYCVIPRARGEVRSQTPERIAEEVAALVKNGYREVTLTGINLSRYGSDMGLTLADAVEAANSAAGDFRLRLGSLEPDLLTEDILTRLAKCERLCPHFHPALQSGCDRTLKSMRRRYTTEEYRRVINRIKELFPEAKFSTDIMVGFPGETDEDFEETLAFVREMGFLYAHLFIFSPRKGTLAAEMAGRVDGATAAERQKALSAAVNNSGSAAAQAAVGTAVRVLAEANGRGFADDMTEVLLPEGCAPGEFVVLRLTSAEGPALCRGEHI